MLEIFRGRRNTDGECLLEMLPGVPSPTHTSSAVEYKKGSEVHVKASEAIIRVSRLKLLDLREFLT